MRAVLYIVAVLLVAVSAVALTPDLQLLETARYMADQLGDPSAAEAVIASGLDRERELIRDAKGIVVGRIEEVEERWSEDDRGHPVRPVWLEVTMTADGYLFGDCGDTLVFCQYQLNPTIDLVPSEAITRSATYAQGDTALVLLYADCAHLGECRYPTARSYKYSLSTGVVESKGILLEDFLSELEEVMVAGSSDTTGASPN